MEELFIFGLAIGAVLSLIISAVLLRLGVMIDRFPIAGEEERELSLWSPVQFTRISVLTYWPLYIVGGYMVFQPERLMWIGGITLLFGLVLFLITAVLFSAAVYNLMRSGNKESGMPSPVAGLAGGIPRFSFMKLFAGTKLRTSGKYPRAGPSVFRK
jgi:hypothetical protein